MDERDIARKPIKDKHPRYGMGYEYYDWMCPKCNFFLQFEPAYRDIPRRCQNCGQLLATITREEAEAQDESEGILLII